MQTNGEVAPPDAILQSCQALNLTLGKLIDSFQEEIAKFKGNTTLTGIAGNQNDPDGDQNMQQQQQQMQMPYWKSI